MERAVMRNGRLRQVRLYMRQDAWPMPCQNSSHRNHVNSVHITQAPPAFLSSSPDCSPP